MSGSIATVMPSKTTHRHDPLQAEVTQWYGANARDLPWRAVDATPWGILVSEFMLQQTPVTRVLPAWRTWLARWPTPSALADEPAGEAVRAWGRLGYPRRALRLHATAAQIVARHGGDVPAGHDDLLALPGVGSYTAAAIASFAFAGRHAVLDTNVRRVLARAVSGEALPPVAQTAGELRTAEALLPRHGRDAARWGVAVMELGALVCTARAPRCTACPIAQRCAWRAAGYPPWTGPPRRTQGYVGTDRQVRGRLLTVLREAHGPVEAGLLATVWDDVGQRERALAGLVVDGLVVRTDDGRVSLPG